MGSQAMARILEHPKELELTVLARKSRKSHRILDPLERQGKLRVIWGDLSNYADVAAGVLDADYVLHVGGMVSPHADHYPELTWKVNTGAAKNIVRAVRNRPDRGAGVAVVYIGSVAQLGNRNQPLHWGRAGDPVWAAKYDVYALSKIEAERIIADSGIPRWVSLRQTGILAHNLIQKASDPITFHVPVDEVLEWATAEDSGRLMCNLCLADLPEPFWKRFYNIGGGEGFRVTNYEFEQLIMEAMHCPDPRKVFDANWFATRNFHGQWYEDSDLLEEWVHFREDDDIRSYLKRFSDSLPWFFSLAAIVPAGVIKFFMKQVAKNKKLGTLSWVKGTDPGRLEAYFGGLEEWKKIPSWDERDLSRPTTAPVRLDHGYDESLPEDRITLGMLEQAAQFRGGHCLSAINKRGLLGKSPDPDSVADIDKPMEWTCHEGHKFTATPRLILLGGHWCPQCFGPDADYDAIAASNPFFSQVWG